MVRALYILMAEMLEQLELPVGAFRKDGGAKGFHDLLDCHCLASELVFGRAVRRTTGQLESSTAPAVTYQTRPNAPMPTG